jgi:hypothetical protein
MDDALNWFEKNCIPLWGVNENPQQSEWTTSNKVYAEAYVDDAAVGCPLIWTSSRPYVDWLKVDQILFGNFEGERSFEPVPFISEEDLPKDK